MAPGGPWLTSAPHVSISLEGETAKTATELLHLVYTGRAVAESKEALESLRGLARRLGIKGVVGIEEENGPDERESDSVIRKKLR